MAWTAPRTWVTGETPTAALLNTHVRDNFLEQETAKATTAGDLFYATGANALARLGIGAAGRFLAGGASAPSWVALRHQSTYFCTLDTSTTSTGGTNPNGNGANGALGVSWPTAGPDRYLIECYIRYSCGGTGALRISISYLAGATTLVRGITSLGWDTSNVWSQRLDGNWSSSTSPTFSTTKDAVYLSMIAGETGGTPGDYAYVYFATTVAGQSVTVKAGSWLRWIKVN